MPVSAAIPVSASREAISPARRAAFTLLETMVGLSIFLIAGLGVMEIIGLINQNATANRAISAARLLVGAKISKVQTDTYTPSNNVVPVGCVAPANNIAVADSADPFDFAGTGVTIIGSTDTKTVISGTLTHYVSTFESASHALLITYTMNFTYRGKTYTVTQSTCRAPDQL